MKKIKLNLKTKSLLSLGIITSASLITIFSMFSYANNSDEVKGAQLKVEAKDLKNDFTSIYDENKVLKPEISILDPLKTKKVGIVNEDYTSFSFVDNPKKEYSFEEFYAEYFKKYNEGFILGVKYGSFNFYNEYVLAVRPKDFIEFSKWFIENVSWGPDLLTLSSFRIVSGVETNGNSIVLGSHSTVHKEESEIKFFPDAFFGSLPIFSNLTGAGNASDALTYSLFNGNQDKQTLVEFLESIPLASAAKNAASAADNKAFRAIINPKKLEGSVFKVAPSTDDKDKEGKEVVILSESATQQEIDQLNKESISDQENQKIPTIDTFKNAVVQKVTSQRKQLKIDFEITNEDNTKQIISKTFSNSSIDNKWLVSYNTLKNAYKDSKFAIVNFLDFYDILAYLNKKIWIYQPNDQKIQYFSSKIEAINNLDEIKDWNRSTDDQKILLNEYTIKNLEVNNKKLVVTFENDKKQILTREFDAENPNFDEFDNFKYAAGYKGAINPITLFASQEDRSKKDSEGNSLTGLDAREYQLYNEVYPGLIDKVIRKYPFLLKKQYGPHVKRKLNDEGFYEYSLENGEYIGFSEKDRIGLPIILGTLIKDFEGISTDFLKYVGVHEYGHHYTLDQNQALNQENNAVIIGAMSVRGGLSENSYYSVQALRNYLYARTNLDFVRVNSLGNPSPKNGIFLKWLFTKNDGTIEKETDKDVWGSLDKNISKVLQNKKRRFLQTFEGMKEAAKLRNVKLGDLFIANSFDEHSGTLNPQIDGPAIAVAKKDDGSSYEFKNITVEDILNIIKDGRNTPLKGIVEQTDKGLNAELVTLETKEEDNKKITVATKINVFNKDGSPFINVPLNVPLSEEDLNYIEAQKKLFSEVIGNLTSLRYFDSGWNGRDSFFVETANPYVRWLTLFKEVFSEEPDLTSIKNNLLFRSNADEIDPSKNSIESTRKAFEYTAVSSKSTLATQITNLLGTVRSMLNKPLATKAQVNNVLAFVQNNKITNKYTFPAIYGDETNKDENNTYPTFLNDNFSNGNYDRYFRLIGLYSNHKNNVKGSLQNNPIYDLLLATNFVSQTPKVLILDSSNNLVKLNDLSKANKVVLWDVEGKWPLYSAYSSSLKQTITYNGVTKTAPVFSDFDAFFEFASIDYSKANLVSVIQDNDADFNWNIDYVKTKFDFDTFKAEAAKSSEDSDAKNAIEQNSDQAIANLLMYRFIRSNNFFAVKDFNPLTDLDKNKAIFSKKYGTGLTNNLFRENFVYDLNKVSSDKTTWFNIDAVNQGISEFIKSIIGEVDQTKWKQIAANINTLDLFKYMGNIALWLKNGLAEGNLGTLAYPIFYLPSSSSDDVINYNSTRTESQVADKFTDYIYSLAETLTRDFVQTTYVPSFKEFGNLPSFLTGVNEAETNLDYVLDVTKLKYLDTSKNKKDTINEGILDVINAKYDQETFESLRPLYKEIFNNRQKLNEIKVQIEQLTKEKTELEKQASQNSKKIEELNAQIEELNKNKKVFEEFIKNSDTEIKNKMIEIVPKLKDNHYFNKPTNIFSDGETRNSNYFGKLISKSNGYFKDRFEKDKIGMGLYDKEGNEVQDDTIRLKDLSNNAITSRPRAFFISQLYNYGVGKRTVSGLFRNKQTDLIGLYGFVKKEDGDQIDRLRFTDVETGEVKYLKVNFQDTNNIFYLKNQTDINSKHTLADEGYVTWISDNAIMGKYRNTLLLPKHNYYVHFVDKEGNVVSDFTLGDLDTLSENGKLASQAPIKIQKNKDKKTQDKGKSIIKIDYQFNIQ